MASSPKQANGNLPSNGSGGKRKKSRGNKGSYLAKWLDKTMNHIQETTPSADVYDTYLNSNMNWPMGSQFATGYDPYRYSVYGCGAEPMSLPSLPTYYNPHVPPPYSDYRYMHEHKSVQVQNPRPRRRSENKTEELLSTPVNTNQTNYLQPKNFTDSQDYTSLPPLVTPMAETNSNSDLQTDDKDDCNARRFSDPCVRGLPDVARPANGDLDSDSQTSSGLSGSQVGSRLLSCLLDQIGTLKVANDRLNKELQETRAELEAVRHHGAYLPKLPPNIASASNLNGNGGQYSPGFVTDLVREIRDAARMREEAMYARLRTMVLERTDSGISSAESKLAERTLDEVKSALRASEGDKRRLMDRIVKLQDELEVLRLTSSYESNDSRLNGNVEDIECERMRKELADTRRAKQSAEKHALKLERLVTQLRSKFNGLQITNGSDSLPSESEHDTRSRRANSTTNLTNMTNNLTNMTNNLTNMTTNMTNSTNPTNTNSIPAVVLGPVTDL